MKQEASTSRSVRGETSQSPEKNRNQARLAVWELGLKGGPQVWEIEQLSKIIKAPLHLQCSLAGTKVLGRHIAW